MARPREFDTESVLDAARDEFWASGYRATSTEAIATATGLGKGSLYGAFGSKHALFMTVLERYCHDVVEEAKKALAGPDNEALQRLERYLLSTNRSPESGLFRGCLLTKGVAELAEHDAQVADQACRAFRDVERHIAEAVAAAQRYGDIDPSADPTELARLLIAVQRGVDVVGTAGLGAEYLAGVVRAVLGLMPKRDIRDIPDTRGAGR